jgi:hypothetical protein
MKKDINLYTYHTNCPNCNGFNTRLCKSLNLEYVLCYSCSLVFKPNEEELKKIKTPYPIEMAINKKYENLADQELNYIKDVYNTNIAAKSNNLEALYKEIRKATLQFLDENNFKNVVLFNNALKNESEIKNCTIIDQTKIKNIEKIIYKDILKNGKIDAVFVENPCSIVLSELLSRIIGSITDNCIFVIYAPIVDNIYNNYQNFIKNNNYFYNTYTICREFGNIDYNIFNMNKLDNFYQFILKHGSNKDEQFNEKISKISRKEMRNVMYSEPLMVISEWL